MGTCTWTWHRHRISIFARFLLVVALLVASAGCDSITDLLGVTPQETLEMPLPRDNGYNSFDDWNGLAGLYVLLDGAVERTFDGKDFPVEPFTVPDKGRIIVEVLLRKESSHRPGTSGNTITRGHFQWVLEPDVTWSLRFDRAAYPPVASQPSPPGEPQVLCNWRGCREYWRFPISEYEHNYEGEALWAVLFGSTPCPKGAVCD